MTTATDRLNGLIGSVGIKPPVKLATTANITLSGEQTIDGVTAISGNRILVKNQTDGTENGIYIVSTSDWKRASDFNGVNDILNGSQIYVALGNVNNRKTYAVSTENPVIGTSVLSFVLLSVESTDDIFITATGSTTARTLKDRFSEIRNVKDWGAVGDGATNDTTAIQACINVGEGIVFFPKGTYNVTGLDIGNNVTLDGQGFSSAIFLIANSNRSVFRTVPSGSQVFNLTIRNLFIDGNYSNQTAGTEVHGIELFGSINARIYNCEIYRCLENGIYCYGDSSTLCVDTYIYNNKIFDVGRIGIEFGVFSATLECHGNLVGPINNQTSSLFGIRISNVDTRVYGNHIFSAKITNIQIDRVVNAQVFGNHLESSRGHGLIAAGSKQAIISNNTVVKSGRSNNPATPNTYSGIYIKKDDLNNPNSDLLIIGNSCHSEGVQENSILLQKYGIEIASNDAINNGIIAHNNNNGNATGGINKLSLNGVFIENNLPLNEFFSNNVEYYDVQANTPLTKTLTINVQAVLGAFLQGPVCVFDIYLGYNEATLTQEGRMVHIELHISKITSGLFVTNFNVVSSTTDQPVYTVTRSVDTNTQMTLNIEITSQRGIYIKSSQKKLAIAPRSYFTYTQSLS